METNNHGRELRRLTDPGADADLLIVRIIMMLLTRPQSDVHTKDPQDTRDLIDAFLDAMSISADPL